MRLGSELKNELIMVRIDEKLGTVIPNGLRRLPRSGMVGKVRLLISLSIGAANPSAIVIANTSRSV